MTDKEELLIGVFRSEILSVIDTAITPHSYDKAEACLELLLSMELSSSALNYLITSVVGLLQPDFYYGVKVFSHISDINLKPLRMYSYIVANVPREWIGYLANGINVRNNKIFDICLKDERCWLYLLSNPYLPCVKRKKISGMVEKYVTEGEDTEYKRVLYGVMQGCILGKNLDALNILIGR